MAEKTIRVFLAAAREREGRLEIMGYTLKDGARGDFRPVRIHAKGEPANALRAVIEAKKHADDANDNLSHSRIVVEMTGRWTRGVADRAFHWFGQTPPRDEMWIFLPSSVGEVSQISVPEPIERLRRLVLSGIRRALQLDGHHKSYEGHLEVKVVLPNIFDHDQRPTFVVELSCYVLGPSRGYEWTSRVSLEDAIAQATADVGSWIDELEKNEEEEAEAA